MRSNIQNFVIYIKLFIISLFIIVKQWKQNDPQWSD